MVRACCSVCRLQYVIQFLLSQSTMKLNTFSSFVLIDSTPFSSCCQCWHFAPIVDTQLSAVDLVTSMVCHAQCMVSVGHVYTGVASSSSSWCRVKPGVPSLTNLHVDVRSLMLIISAVWNWNLFLHNLRWRSIIDAHQLHLAAVSIIWSILLQWWCPWQMMKADDDYMYTCGRLQALQLKIKN